MSFKGHAYVVGMGFERADLRRARILREDAVPLW
jgi:hypothetical protein